MNRWICSIILLMVTCSASAELSISAHGRIVNDTIRMVNSEVEGVIRLKTKQGKLVETGERIAEVDCWRQMAELNKLKHKAKKALLERDANRRDAERKRKGQHVVTESEKDWAIYTYQSSEIKLQQAKEEIKTTESVLGRCTIDAPFDSYIIEQHITDGQFVKIGTSVVSLANLDENQLAVYVPRKYVANINSKKEFQATVFDNKKINVVLDRISEHTEKGTNTVQVIFNYNKDDCGHACKLFSQGFVQLTVKTIGEDE